MSCDDDSEGATLTRHHPLSTFLKSEGNKLEGLSQEEFTSQYEKHVKESRGQSSGSTSSNASTRAECAIGGDDDTKTAEAAASIGRSNTTSSSSTSSSSSSSSSSSVSSPSASSPSDVQSDLSQIVLKFTTFSESCTEAPSFTVTMEGARIGRDSSNEISVPSDPRLASVAHAKIEFKNGCFHIVDNGHPYCTSIRIGMKSSYIKQWVMEKDARLSAGNSVFKSLGQDSEGNLLLEVLDGPLKGERKIVTKHGATLGRSSENQISIPDRELSRKHSKLEYDSNLKQYVVSDSGSTNGTYMQLIGPYGGPHKLSLNDHILVGRTGFSINLFDYGLSEEMGHRQTMEDACIIVQNLNVNLSHDLSPQSFFGVFDGHGGNHASMYLSQALHLNVSECLANMSSELIKACKESNAGVSSPSGDSESMVPSSPIDIMVANALKKVYLMTDADFISQSSHPQHGSTATTALILGKRLYCANVGDSRTLLCRNFQAVALSQDHKPSREDETKRIRDAGGFIINNRVMGELAVSRAFGDAEFKKGIQSIIEEEGGAMGGDMSGEAKNWDEPLIIAEPDVTATIVTEKDQFLLLACDGLFDVFTGEEIVDFVIRDMEEHSDAQRCCQHLTHEAIRKRNSRDNVSVILIILNKWY